MFFLVVLILIGIVGGSARELRLAPFGWMALLSLPAALVSLWRLSAGMARLGQDPNSAFDLGPVMTSWTATFAACAVAYLIGFGIGKYRRRNATTADDEIDTLPG